MNYGADMRSNSKLLRAVAPANRIDRRRATVLSVPYVCLFVLQVPAHKNALILEIKARRSQATPMEVSDLNGTKMSYI
jgi:hypothetical protein